MLYLCEGVVRMGGAHGVGIVEGGEPPIDGDNSTDMTDETVDAAVAVLLDEVAPPCPCWQFLEPLPPARVLPIGIRRGKDHRQRQADERRLWDYLKQGHDLDLLRDHRDGDDRRLVQAFEDLTSPLPDGVCPEIAREVVLRWGREQDQGTIDQWADLTARGALISSVSPDEVRDGVAAGLFDGGYPRPFGDGRNVSFVICQWAEDDPSETLANQLRRPDADGYRLTRNPAMRRFLAERGKEEPDLRVLPARGVLVETLVFAKVVEQSPEHVTYVFTDGEPESRVVQPLPMMSPVLWQRVYEVMRNHREWVDQFGQAQFTTVSAMRASQPTAFSPGPREFDPVAEAIAGAPALIQDIRQRGVIAESAINRYLDKVGDRVRKRRTTTPNSPPLPPKWKHVARAKLLELLHQGLDDHAAGGQPDSRV
jgi:hypothetical protein